ncbi:Protein of unknown function [Marinospirillum celere]|uniref:DUF3095 domain-containing protein n=1 Tax=Marinospirillum celere TaxID=1122252 RepID=A0A1I1EMA3_9GAMM|nr:DUF3095 domain-containing protein [Marinospirillum celere]SFB88215.1 Protein of unknown function [Marinospirillum celere]
MNPGKHDHFFEDLPPLAQFSEVLLIDNYQELPDDWWVVVTDVQGSTKAIEEGRYREINSLGGCTVAAMLNAVKPMAIPYVFGGDGASFCIPPGYLEPVRKALQGCKELASEHFNLNLRTGLLPYSEISKKAPLLVCRFSKSKDLQQAIFAGDGMQEADRLVKQDNRWEVSYDKATAAADFSGFECRWQQIPSPREVTVSLLVQVRSSSLAEEMKLYQELLAKMQEILGTDDLQQPLTAKGMRLSFSSNKLAAESRVKSYMNPESTHRKQLWKLRFLNFLGLILMGLNLRTGKAEWGRYKQDAVVSSDYRKFDGVFRSVFAADTKDLDSFTEWLDQQQAASKLNYGIHVSKAAQLTCVVSETGVKHIHFVDGCDGGYALAARELKQKIIEKL